MENQLSALIIASPGPLRDGLQTLLSAIPAIAQVLFAEAGPAIDALVVSDAPAIIVLDCQAQAFDMSATLRQVKARWPATPCIVLVDSEHQNDALPTAGADMLFLKGVLASRLFVAIADLLA